MLDVSSFCLVDKQIMTRMVARDDPELWPIIGSEAFRESDFYSSERRVRGARRIFNPSVASSGRSKRLVLKLVQLAIAYVHALLHERHVDDEERNEEVARGFWSASC